MWELCEKEVLATIIKLILPSLLTSTISFDSQNYIWIYIPWIFCSRPSITLLDKQVNSWLGIIIPLEWGEIGTQLACAMEQITTKLTSLKQQWLILHDFIGWQGASAGFAWTRYAGCWWVIWIGRYETASLVSLAVGARCGLCLAFPPRGFSCNRLD